ncbi:MAG TPA: type II secretion system protein GspG [Acidobacteriota bacterium]|nr:type II secretion system protein GspG [Acidobacteriota bacterium]
MLDRSRGARQFLLLLLTIVAFGCGPSELATPTADEIEALLNTTFPRAAGQVEVRGVERVENTARVRAEYAGSDVTVLLLAGESAWAVDGAEMGGNTYTTDQLHSIGDSLALMQEVSDALAVFRTATGAYPRFEDLVGLRELVPDYYSPPETGFIDGWGNGLRYRMREDEYTLTSDGPDGHGGTTDDLFLITGPGEDGTGAQE